MKVEKTHTNALGFTHGGAIFSLADYAFAQACNFGDNVAVALQVSINFLKPSVEGDILTAEAVRASDGKTTGIYQVTVRKEDKPIALFTGLAFKK
jgi:acyl-CoA thioesterase